CELSILTKNIYLASNLKISITGSVLTQRNSPYEIARCFYSFVDGNRRHEETFLREHKSL
ncbi:TPA: hypothetical protein ACOZZ9_004951, partial [Escherichia coli]